jgi:hypothetical protein
MHLGHRESGSVVLVLLLKVLKLSVSMGLVTLLLKRDSHWIII